jgi:hypothetical protein
MKGLELCPKCGNTELDLKAQNGKYAIICGGCLHEGPPSDEHHGNEYGIKYAKTAAKRRWNRAARKEKPRPYCAVPYRA